MPRTPDATDFAGWVRKLAVSDQRQQAKRHLRLAGPAAVPALRSGMRHPKPIVRQLCVGILDQLADRDAFTDLAAALDDDDTGVIRRALHALACDACKQGECRPADDLWVPRALGLLRTSPNPDVRAAAIDALGKVAARRADVAASLESAAEHDRHPGLRSMARRRLPRTPIAGEGE